MTEEVAIGDVAAYVGYSLSHFNHLFKTYTEHTPYSYFNFLRINEAKYMLLNTSQTISTIAETLNFKNASKFSEAFKRECGITPGQFRKLREIDSYV